MDKDTILKKFKKSYGDHLYILNLNRKNKLLLEADKGVQHGMCVTGYEVFTADNVFVGLYDPIKDEIYYTINPN